MDETRYVREGEVAKMTGLSVKRLRNDRFLRKGLPYVKVGRSVLYSQADVIEFMESRKIDPEALT